MKCELLKRYSDAYVDGEVSAETALEVERHLEDCSACRDAVELLLAMKQEVKRLGLSTQAPASLRSRIRRQLEHQELPDAGASWDSALASGPLFGWDGGRDSHPDNAIDPRRGGPFIRFLPVTGRAAAGLGVLAAGALLTFYFGTSSFTDSNQATVALPVLEDIVRVHSSELPADVGGEEPHVTRYFRDRVRFPVRPARFDGQRAKLLGARLSNVRENRAAALYYEVDGRRVTVVVFDGHEKAVTNGAKRARLQGQELYYRQVHGYPVPVRRQDGINYAFTGEMDRQSLLQLAASARFSY